MSLSRGLLHSGLYTLRLDGKMDVGSWIVQAVVADGLLAVHGFRLQYRLNQLRSLPICHASSKYTPRRLANVISKVTLLTLTSHYSSAHVRPHPHEARAFFFLFTALSQEISEYT